MKKNVNNLHTSAERKYKIRKKFEKIENFWKKLKIFGKN